MLNYVTAIPPEAGRVISMVVFRGAIIIASEHGKIYEILPAAKGEEYPTLREVVLRWVACENPASSNT